MTMEHTETLKGNSLLCLKFYDNHDKCSLETIWHEIQKESWQSILSGHQKLSSMIVVANLEQEDRTFEIGI